MADRIRTIHFPFRRSATEFPVSGGDRDSIRSSIIQIISTRKGERVMRPTFGCDAFSYVFESDTDDFRSSVEREVRQAIKKWEKRVRIDGVRVSSDNISEPDGILITVDYTILHTSERGRVTVAGGQ